MEPVEFQKRKISSFMFTGKINSAVDLDNIISKLPIDNVIIGMKCNNMYKGDIQRTNCFYNQISFNINLENLNAKMNIKVFNTGSFQVSGAKTESEVKTAINYIIEQLKKLNGCEKRKVMCRNGFLYDENDYFMFTNKKKERCKNIKIYNKDGEIVGFKNGDYLSFHGREIKFDKDFNVYYDIVRNSFTKNVYNTNGDVIGKINFELVSNKNLKRIQITKNLILEKTDDNTVHYYKIFKFNNEKVKTLCFTKHLVIESGNELLDNEGITEIKATFKVLKNTDNINDFTINVSNMNNVFYFTKEQDYYLDCDAFLRYFTKLNIGVYRNNTVIKYNVLTMVLYFDSELANLVSKNEKAHEFTISYYTLHNKIMVSGLQKYEHVEMIEKFLINAINESRNETFYKIKKFNKNKNTEKINLSSLL